MKIIPSAIFTFLILLPPAYAEKQLVDRVVAVVNSEVITQSELDILLRPLYEEYRHEFEGQELYKRLTEARLKILNQLIEDRLVFQEAEAQKIEVESTEVNEMVDEFKKNFEDDAELEEGLKNQGMTMNSVRERLRKQAMVRRLHDTEIRAHVMVSPLDIENYYAEHPEEFDQMAKLKIRSITIKKSDDARKNGTKDESAWQRIEDLRSRIVKGEKFGDLAQQYSQDVHAAKNGLGDWVQEGEMIPAIDAVIFKLGIGEVSTVIETAMGYHLFQVEEREEGKHFSLEEVRDQIRAFLFHKQSEERFQQWMEELKQKAYISVR